MDARKEVKCPKCGRLVEFKAGEVKRACECGEVLMAVRRSEPVEFTR